MKKKVLEMIKKYKLVAVLVVVEIILGMATMITKNSNYLICAVAGIAVIGVIIEDVYSDYLYDQEMEKENGKKKKKKKKSNKK